MTKVPVKCPNCGHPEVQAQVVAWAIYRDGKLQLVDADVGVEDVSGAPAAHCENCNYDWELEE